MAGSTPTSQGDQSCRLRNGRDGDVGPERARHAKQARIAARRGSRQLAPIWRRRRASDARSVRLGALGTCAAVGIDASGLDDALEYVLVVVEGVRTADGRGQPPPTAAARPSRAGTTHILQPVDVALDVHADCRQRIEILAGPPAKEDPQVELGATGSRRGSDPGTRTPPRAGQANRLAQRQDREQGRLPGVPLPTMNASTHERAVDSRSGLH
jgi:hypothetical protein